jgi:hypothetical protein
VSQIGSLVSHLAPDSLTQVPGTGLASTKVDPLTRARVALLAGTCPRPCGDRDRMPQPHDRLTRHFFGQGLAIVRPQMARLLSRREREVKRIVELPSPREPRGRSVRLLRARSQPAPNAPQLIRILRHPFRLDPGYFERRRAEARGMVHREARQGFRDQVEKVLHGPKRVQAFRPVPKRPRISRPELPTVDAWLAMSGPR